MADNNRTIIKTIQGLRGVAALLILLSHYSFIKRKTMIFPTEGVELGQNVLMWVGAMGVVIFIMLSGFLTYVNYNDRICSYEVKKRIVSQYKKLLPLHLITMILAFPLLYQTYLLKPVNTAIKILFNATLLHAWIPHMGIYYSFNTVSWYLCLVIFFALTTPFMLRLINKVDILGGKKGIWIMLLNVIALQCCIGIAGTKIAQYESIGVGHWFVYIFPVTRLADFFCGGVTGFVWMKTKEVKRTYSYPFAFTCAVIICCIVTLFSNMYKSELFSVFVWTIPCIVIVYCVAIADTDSYINKIFTTEFLQFMGNISLELFFLHQLVMRYVLKIASYFTDEDKWYLYLISLGLSILLAYIVHIAKMRIQNKRKI